MEWCSRHLNWTVTITAIGAWACSLLLVRFYLFVTGMSYIPFPGADYIPSIVNGTARNYEDFTGQIFVDIAVLVSLPIFIWVLKRKNRSNWYILFFLPPLLMSAGSSWLNFFYCSWRSG